MEQYDMLEKLRENIDTIDKEILILLKRRFQTVKKVAQYKQKKDMEIYQPDRETDIIMKITSNATTMNINESFARNLFQSIIDESKKEQETLLKKENNKL